MIKMGEGESAVCSGRDIIVMHEGERERGWIFFSRWIRGGNSV